MSTHTGAGARRSITACSDDLQRQNIGRNCIRTTLISILSAGKLENENGRYPPGKTGDGSTGSLSLARIGIIITDIYPVKREYTIGGGRIESQGGCSREVHRKPRRQAAQLLIMVSHLGAPILHYSAPQTYNSSTLKLQLSSV